MALITCPECQQQISDQAAACPKCGYPLAKVSAHPSEIDIAEDSQIAQPATAPQSSPKNAKTAGIIAGCIAACFAIVIAIVFYAGKSAEKNARAEYIASLESFMRTSLDGAAEAENVCGLTYKVWYDTIYEEYRSETYEYTHTNGDYNEDFNDSLVALYSSSDMIVSVASIKVNQEEVDQLYKSLQNPTEEFASCFAAVEGMYTAYCKLTNLAVSPSGSLRTYSEDYSDYDDSYLEYYKKLELLIPSE